MKIRSIIIVTILSSLIGMLFFLIHRRLIIIQFNIRIPINSSMYELPKNTTLQKTVKIYFYKNNIWNSDSINLVWHDDNQVQNFKSLLHQWLAVQIDENLISLHTKIESVALSKPKSDLYISFDRSIFNKESSVMQKWFLIESLIKTINFIDSGIQTVTFLVQYKPIQDDHLVLSYPIVVQQFCS